MAASRKGAPSGLADTPGLAAFRRKAQIGIVGPQDETVLGPAREHAVGFSGSPCDQIIDHDAEIGFCPVKPYARKTSSEARRVDPGDQSLARRLLVSRGAIDLARQEQTRNPRCLQRVIELARIDVVVLDGVAVTQDSCSAQTRYRDDEGLLDVARQRRGNAVRVDRRGPEPLGFQKDPVAFPVAEPHHLVLDGRAVAGTGTVDSAGVDGCTVKIGANDVVRGLRGRRHMTGNLRHRDGVRQPRERLRRIVSGLDLQGGMVDRPCVNPWRRPRLQPSKGKTVPLERRGERHGGVLIDPSRRPALVTDVNHPAQEGSGGENHGATTTDPAVGKPDSGNPSGRVYDQVRRLAF